MRMSFALLMAVLPLRLPAAAATATSPSLVNLFPRGALDVSCYFGPITDAGGPPS
jgi:hypothetical protein